MIKESIQAIIDGRSLSTDEAAQVMQEIMDGQATPAQFGAFVTALRAKGETVEEIAGMVRTMRARAVRVNACGPLVDTCGTGGDGAATFNISTAAAFVAAGAGLKVAKHGNRAMSSRCGSADVLEALGIRIDLSPTQVARCLEEVGLGFMFAPAFHPAMKHAAAPRREIGIRTVFNILGPLTNPAAAEAQVVGVADSTLLEKIARVLSSLGSRHVLVVHGADGLDEITLTGPTHICEMKEGNLTRFSITPEEVGLRRCRLEELRGSDAEHNAILLRDVLSGNPGARHDVVLLNAAAALLVADRVDSLRAGVDMARQAIRSGRALVKLEMLARLTRSFKEESTMTSENPALDLREARGPG